MKLSHKLTCLKAFLFVCAIVLASDNIAFSQASATKSPQVRWESSELVKGVKWLRFLGEDARFGSNQSYNAIEVQLDSADVDVEFLWFFERTALLSMIANQVGALAATNGTYLEVGSQHFETRDSVYQTITISEEDYGFWMNEGAVYRDSCGRFGVTYADSDDYENMNYPDVMSAGPVLIEQNEPMGLSVHERPHRTHEYTHHPRTVVGVTDEGKRLIFLTVDGRSEKAEGMTIPQLTELMQKDFYASGALNLDGGGTTTLWIKGKTPNGIVNYPSGNGLFDHEGERWTGQAIVILPKNKDDVTHVGSNKRCAVVFNASEEPEINEEQYIYLGDQLGGLMDMPAGQDFTISLWIKPAPGDQLQTLFNKQTSNNEHGGSSRGYEVYMAPSGHLTAILDTGNKEVKLQSEEKVQGDEWNHIALTLKGSEAALYINGQSSARESSSALKKGFDNKHFLTAGARREWSTENHDGRTWPHSPWGRPQFSFSSAPFMGSMDEFQVWHRGLSPEEINKLADERLFEASMPIESQGLVSFWKFNETEGNLAVDEQGNVHGTYMGDFQRSCTDIPASAH